MHYPNIFPQTDIVVVGHNSESADFDNPRGELYGYRGYVVAEARDGSRRLFERTLTLRSEQAVLERLQTYCDHVNRMIAAGATLDPSRWTATRPAYGSEAYANGGWSERDFHEEREEAVNDNYGWPR